MPPDNHVVGRDVVPLSFNPILFEMVFVLDLSKSRMQAGSNANQRFSLALAVKSGGVTICIRASATSTVTTVETPSGSTIKMLAGTKWFSSAWDNQRSPSSSALFLIYHLPILESFL
jgi:hypothetical protein